MAIEASISNGSTASRSPHEPQHLTIASSATTSSSTIHIYPILGLFTFYILHDALQERMFRFEGFTFGFFMTLIEVLLMLLASALLELYRQKQRATGSGVKNKMHVLLGSGLKMGVLARISVVGLFLACAHGLGNTALRYSPYPLKVAFKSCKLVPTMALGACVTGHKYTALQYTAALVMGMGLAVLTAADVFTTTRNDGLKLVRNLNVAVSDTAGLSHNDSFEDWALGPLLGPTLLTISTFFDSVVPNLQEQLLQSHKVQTSEMIFVSNAIMCIVLLGYTIYSRELMEAWDYCSHHWDASFVLIMQGICAYLGLQCYLAIIRDHGGVAAVVFANGRKIATIVLSFMLFAKPFNSRHFVGLVLVFVGVYLGYVSKKMGGAKKKKKKRRRKRDVDDDDNAEHHEHKV